MNKEKFLNELKTKLKKLPDYEVEKIISFYEESIGDRTDSGMSEEQAVAEMGSTSEIAHTILVDTPIPTLVKEKVKDMQDKSKGKKALKIVALSTAIIWVPVTIALIVALFAVYLAIWIVALSLYIALLGIAAGSVLFLTLGILNIVANDVFVGLALISMSLATAGIFVMSIKPLNWLSRQIASLTVVLTRKIKKSFFPKKAKEEDVIE